MSMGLIGDLIEFSRNKKAVREMKQSWIFADYTEEDWKRMEAEARREVAEKRARDEYRRTSVACCDNCYWFSHNVFSIDYAANCLKHDIGFTHDDIDSNRHRRKCCDNFKPK